LFGPSPLSSVIFRVTSHSRKLENHFLPSLSVVYRDLKPPNLGFDVRGNIRLFDFGVAKELKCKDRVNEDQYNCTPLTGTRVGSASFSVFVYRWLLKSLRQLVH